MTTFFIFRSLMYSDKINIKITLTRDLWNTKLRLGLRFHHQILNHFQNPSRTSQKIFFCQNCYFPHVIYSLKHDIIAKTKSTMVATSPTVFFTRFDAKRNSEKINVYTSYRRVKGTMHHQTKYGQNQSKTIELISCRLKETIILLKNQSNFFVFIKSLENANPSKEAHGFKSKSLPKQ